MTFVAIAALVISIFTFKSKTDVAVAGAAAVTQIPAAIDRHTQAVTQQNELRAQIKADIKQAIAETRATSSVPAAIIVEHDENVFADPAPARHEYLEPASSGGYLGE